MRSLFRWIFRRDKMANNLTVTGTLDVAGVATLAGATEISGTVDLSGGALDTTLVANLNADLFDSAEKSTDGTLVTNSDALVPTEKAVKTYVDTNAMFLTGDQTIAGHKTFSEGTRGGIQDVNNVHLKVKKMDIGDWNMNTSGSNSPAHGITGGENIIMCYATIRQDAPSTNVLSLFTTNSGGTSDGSISWDDTNIFLARWNGGIFDSTSFEDTGYNRGYIYIVYLA